MHSTTILIAAAVAAASASAFSFSTSTPTQCGTFTVTWSGGTAPYHLLLVPTITVTDGRIWNISIPDTANGSYTFDLQEPATLEFLATMWDATGWGSGGTTDVLTVGSSDNSSCLDSNLLYDFYFNLSPNSNPNQCSQMTISWDNNVTQPVGAYGLIPAGSAFSIPVPTTSYTYDWTVDIAAGTDFVLLMADAGTYQTGGSSSLFTVQSSSDSSCLNASSPASATSSAAASSSTGSTSAASASASVAGVGGSSAGGTAGNTSASSSGSSSHTGAIVGGVLGGVAFVVLLSVLLFCCIRRKATGRPLSNYGAGSAGAGVDAETAAEKQNGRGAGKVRTSLAGLLGAGAGRLSGEHTEVDGTDFEVDHDYEASPYRYPSPTQDATPHSLGEAGVAVSAAGAGVAGRNAVAGTGTTEKATPASPTSPTRPAAAPAMPNIPAGATAAVTTEPSEFGQASEQATIGHRDGKFPRAHETADRPLPEPPTPTRFVQHQDAGVVELPPRYDQLRAANPDE
ncbi:hypothetical protein Q5752_004260 [Cryptotrichosporon argae]